MSFAFVFTKPDNKTRRIRIYTPYVGSLPFAVCFFLITFCFVYLSQQSVFLFECFERVKEEASLPAKSCPPWMRCASIKCVSHCIIRLSCPMLRLSCWVYNIIESISPRRYLSLSGRVHLCYISTSLVTGSVCFCVCSFSLSVFPLAFVGQAVFSEECNELMCWFVVLCTAVTRHWAERIRVRPREYFGVIFRWLGLLRHIQGHSEVKRPQYYNTLLKFINQQHSHCNLLAYFLDRTSHVHITPDHLVHANQTRPNVLS